MKLECVGKLPFGTYAEMERAGISLNDIDTSDCDMSLDSLSRIAGRLNLNLGDGADVANPNAPPPPSQNLNVTTTTDDDEDADVDGEFDDGPLQGDEDEHNGLGLEPMDEGSGYGVFPIVAQPQAHHHALQERTSPAVASSVKYEDISDSD
jgi:hypothetical protein